MGSEAILLGALLATSVGTTVYTSNQQEKAQEKANRALLASQQDNAVETDEALEDSEADETAILARKLNLFETEGGASGEELEPDEITQRQTLLGN